MTKASLIPVLGSGAAGVFLISLIASGMSSSAVGTMAGQVIMQGFVGLRISLWLRRLVTMAPSFAIVALGVDATQALVLSQVVLSLILPIPMIALLILTREPRRHGFLREWRLHDGGRNSGGRRRARPQSAVGPANCGRTSIRL